MHQGYPLSLGHFVLSDLETLGDLDAMPWSFIVAACGVAFRTPHHEFPWSYTNELHANLVLELRRGLGWLLATRDGGKEYE